MREITVSSTGYEKGLSGMQEQVAGAFFEGEDAERYVP